MEGEGSRKGQGQGARGKRPTGAASLRQQSTEASCPPPPTANLTVGENEMVEQLMWATKLLLGTQILGFWTPPPRHLHLPTHAWSWVVGTGITTTEPCHVACVQSVKGPALIAFPHIGGGECLPNTRSNPRPLYKDTQSK